MSVLHDFIEGTLVIFLYIVKSHRKHMLIHIGNEMEPFHRDNDEAFLADIIGTGTHHYEEDAAKDDGSQYLNNTGDGDDNQTEQRLCKMIAQRYIQFVLIYINIRINSVCKYNTY